MFVRLGSAYQPHRAHVVRGVLEAHGIPVEVWHEEAAHLYSPGWEPCSVMIPEDEVEAALEVMNARPEELLPEDASAEITVPFRRYPTFLDWMITGAGLILLVGMVEVVSLMPHGMHSRRGGLVSTSGPADPFYALVWLLALVPAAGMLFAALMTVVMVPLVALRGSRWMGLIAYLFAGWFLWIVVPTVIAVVTHQLPHR